MAMISDFEPLRERLAGFEGARLWRGIEELMESQEFHEYLLREFPEQADQWTDQLTRRQLLVLMGASLALAGVSGCSIRPAPAAKIMPYVRQPEEIIPGKPLFFATAMTLAGVATGLLVESHEGRPTKVEGNPKHPASLGATDVWAQASVLTLYDPDRSQSVTYRGRPRAWNEALSALRSALENQRTSRGAGVRILTETVTSPTLKSQLDDLLQEFPAAKWHQYEPTARDNVLAGACLAFGEAVNTIYDFTQAKVVLALDADFLGSGPGHVRYARDFMTRRRVRTKATPPAPATMNHLYAVECMPSSTGAVADHRWPMRAGQIESFVRALAATLQVPDSPPSGETTDLERARLRALADDLRQHTGTSVVLTGESQPPGVHALVHALNQKLGNVGQTVHYTSPVEARPADQLAELRDLVKEMEAGQVELLLVVGGNPVFTAPADFEFGKHMEALRQRFHLGLYQDETAVLCDWHIPEAHYLEAWSDARTYDGTASIVQPLIAPLYGGRSAHEFLAAFTEQPERAGYDIVRDYWRKKLGSGQFERLWQRALQEGIVPGGAREFSPRPMRMQPGWARQPEPAEAPATSATRPGTLDIVFRPDPTIFDGRFANNGWLQELPKPITRLTWDNAAFMSPVTAEKHGLAKSFLAGGGEQDFGRRGGEHGQAIVDRIELRYGGRTITAPVWILPGHADDAVTVHFGYGRERAGTVGNGTGFNAYILRTSKAPWFDSGLEIAATGQRYTLACTQMHHAMQGRAPVHAGTLARFLEDPDFAHTMASAQHEEHEVRRLLPGPKPEAEREPARERRLHPLTLYDPAEYPYDNYKWGMAIDLTACTGCNACVVACQAENNIPVVGKTEVTHGREMHWLRIDRYYAGSLESPTTYFQPVPCMHCENAPCELVCPVGATVHSDDGLNEMIYNRCVGTRYCSNNCPYKVRRFNFLQFADYATESLKLQRNPNVTVRSRGVMEKCTYCVQRIRAAEITAEKAGRRIADGDVVTACQAACPAQAIAFGDLNDKRSRVYLWKDEPLNYGLLAELSTQPRTTYLAALRNPNPKVVGSG
jgi:molybdopterin-containing oxidoreductase family iron-sulfur binding subunit